MKQLPLSIPLRDQSDFDRFYTADENSEAVASLRRCATQQSDQVLLLHGEPQSGRSHLLEAVCSLAQRNKLQALYLPLHTMIESATFELFEGLETVPLLALDDVDCLAGKPGWEEGLFHLYNRGRQHGQCLLLTANTAPAHIPFQLKDLHSRLGAALVYKLHALDENAKLACLKLRGENLGLTISDDVANYILLRANREVSSLMAAVETLNRESLSESRKLTIPFVKKVMNW